MASTAPPTAQATPAGLPWKRWFLLGLCFGVGYGTTQRLISLQFSADWNGQQRFEVKPFPGTELNSLRRKLGDASTEIRGDLDLLELQRREKQEAAAIEDRREAMAEREQPSSDRPPGAAAEPETDPALEPPTLPEAPSLPPPPEPQAGPLLPNSPTDPAPPPAPTP